MANKELVVYDSVANQLGYATPADVVTSPQAINAMGGITLGGVTKTAWDPNLSGRLDLNVTPGTYTLTTLETENTSIALFGTLASPLVLQIPNTATAAHMYTFKNMTVGGVSITVKVVNGTVTVPLPYSKNIQMYSSGTNVNTIDSTNVTLRGARAWLNTSPVVSTAVWQRVDYDTVEFDTENLYNWPGNFTVPAGVTRVRLTAQGYVSSPAGGATYGLIVKNSLATPVARSGGTVGTVGAFNLTSGIVTVVAGDSFSIYTFCNVAGGTLVGAVGDNWFEMEIIE